MQRQRWLGALTLGIKAAHTPTKPFRNQCMSDGMRTIKLHVKDWRSMLLLRMVPMSSF